MNKFIAYLISLTGASQNEDLHAATARNPAFGYVFAPYNENDRKHQDLAKHIGLPISDVPELHFLAKRGTGGLQYTCNYTFRAKDGWFVHDGRASNTVPSRAETRNAAIPLILKLNEEALGGERCASPEDHA